MNVDWSPHAEVCTKLVIILNQGGCMSFKNICSIAIIAIAAIAFSSNAWAVAANCDVGVIPGTNNPEDSTEILGDSNLEIDMLHLTISHEAYGDTSITDITITGSGTGNEAADIESVKLYEDTDGSGLFEAANDTLLATNTFSEDNGTVVLTLDTAIPVTHSSEATYFIVYTIKSSAARGSTFIASWEDNGDMTFGSCTSGPSTTVIAPTPITGGTLTVTYGTAVAVEGTSAPETGDANPGDTNVPVMQFQLTADDSEGLILASVTITDPGAADNADMIAAVKIWNDANGNGQVDEGEAQIGADAVFTAETETLTLDAGDYLIAAGTSLNVLVTYDFTGGTTTSRDTLDNLLIFAKNAARLIIAGPLSIAGCGGSAATTTTDTTPSFTPSIEEINLVGATSNRDMSMTGENITGASISLVE